MNLAKVLCIMAAMVFAMISVAEAQSAQIIYVRKGAPGTGDGTSWANAFPELQPALNKARTLSGSKEVWVAHGEYQPTDNLDRSVSFILPPQTFLYGGFTGNETSLTNRNWRTNRTVLSGDLGALFDKTDNSYHVIVATDVDAQSGINGFIITQGNANGPSGAYHNSGGGMLILSASVSTGPKIENCEFIHNRAALYGGGLANISGNNPVNSTIANCFFNGNSAVFGGGAANKKGVYANEPTFVNCSFSTNKADNNGGAIANVGGNASFINCTFSKNNASENGGAIFNSNAAVPKIKNSILWGNFRANNESLFSQVYNSGSTPVVQNNIIQNGYGTPNDFNLDQDPLFVREPSVVGKFPRTSIVPVSSTDAKYENKVVFNGPALWGPWPYLGFKDHTYNKLYMPGRHFQVLDFGNLVNNRPTSRVYGEIYFPVTQRLDKCVYGNKIFIASIYSGINSIDRASGEIYRYNVLDGEPATNTAITQDLIVDGSTGMLYASVFSSTSATNFVGILELNIATNEKRWINTTSSPINISVPVAILNHDTYWGGQRLFFDENGKTLYFSTGNGVWWWNKTNNTTGVISTQGGMPLKPGNPGLPSNLTTGMFIDYAENKFYIGTHAGLFAWDRNNNTSRVYHTGNSKLMHNLINTIEKSNEHNLIFVSCEEGALFVVNTVTGEEKLIKEDTGNEIYPQFMDNSAASAYYDKTDKKLYVAADHWSGGLWIQDYANLIPDYGDLSLRDSSPAIDLADESIYPPMPTTDILGMPRRVDYASIRGSDGLDQGSYEKPLACPTISSSFSYHNVGNTYTFKPVTTPGQELCDLSYLWNFGDSTTSNLSIATHTFSPAGPSQIMLTISYSCGDCPSAVSSTTATITRSGDMCDQIVCDGFGNYSVGTDSVAVGYRLSVKGKMAVEGIKVAWKSQWPDYVFDKDYELMPLEQLAKYIARNGHLPNIPSSSTVQKEGIDAGEMSMKLLEKVEELSLHFIHLDERLKRMETNTSPTDK